MERTNDRIDLNNTLSADKFKLVFRELKGMEVLCKTAPIPGISSNPVQMNSTQGPFFVQSAKIAYDPLNISFQVDRNLIAYRQIHNWLVAINSPQSSAQYEEFLKNKTTMMPGSSFTVNASLFSLTNSLNSNIEFQFSNIFPTSLGSIDFDNNGGSGTNVLTTANFQYDYFTIRQELNEGRNNLA